MSSQQAENFIAILRTACGNGQKKLCNPNWDELIKTARSQMLTALFYTGAIQYNEFATCPAEQREMLQRQTIAVVGQQARRTQLFLQLYRSLLDAGLKPLVLKGIVCRSLYGDLADYRPSVDEDFYIPPDQVDVMAQVASQVAVPIATGERAINIQEMEQIMVKKAARYVRPDVCALGGISPCKKVAAMAEANYVGIVPHNPLGPVSTAACLQLDACIPNFTIQEFPSFYLSGGESAMLKEPLQVENGYILIPDKPGIGIELAEDITEKFPPKQRSINAQISYDGSVRDL